MKQIIRKGEAHPLEYLKKHCGIEVIAGPNRKLKLIILELSFFFKPVWRIQKSGAPMQRLFSVHICSAIEANIA